jgi:hypothetical protein
MLHFVVGLAKKNQKKFYNRQFWKKQKNFHSSKFENSEQEFKIQANELNARTCSDEMSVESKCVVVKSAQKQTSF